VSKLNEALNYIENLKRELAETNAMGRQITNERDSLRSELSREREKVAALESQVAGLVVDVDEARKWSLGETALAKKNLASAESAERTVKAMGEALVRARTWIPDPRGQAEINAALASLAPSPCEGIKNGLRCSSCVAANKPCAPSQSAEKPDWIALSRHLEIVKGLRAIVDAADALVKSIDSDEDGEGRYDVSVLARLKKLLPPRPGADAAQAQEERP